MWRQSRIYRAMTVICEWKPDACIAISAHGLHHSLFLALAAVDFVARIAGRAFFATAGVWFLESTLLTG